MRNLLIIALLISTVYSANAQENNNIALLNLSDFKTQIENKDVQLIDVRTPEEFKEGHVDGALNIDYYSQGFETQFSKLDKEKPVYLYCRSGFRSNESAKKLAKMGFKTLYDLEGGFLNYNKNKE